MMQVAVNCFVKEARRKLVVGPIGCLVRKSVTPYPWRNTGLPWCTTSTAAPGALLDFSEPKTASIWPDETRVEDRLAQKLKVAGSSIARLLGNITRPPASRQAGGSSKT